jgi:peptide/nickel transport system substrate-binding protein
MRLSSLLLAITLLTSACADPQRAGTDSDAGGTIVVVTAGDAQSIFPPFIEDAIGANLRDQLYDRLAEISNDLNTIGDVGFTPRLADKWEWAKDSLSIAFHLDPRAKWHDGAPVRASDVRYSFKIFADPKLSPSTAPLVTNIDSVSVRDSATAVAWFKQRRPEQFYDFVYQIYVLPEHVFTGVALDQLRTSDLIRRGVGTGRFRLARWDAGQRIELVADTANFRGRPKLDRVIFTIVPDASTAMTQLMSGDADVLEFIPADLAAKVDSSATVHTVPYPALQYAFLGLNLADPKQQSRPHPVFGDRRVRQALSMALDRRAMLQNVWGDAGKLSYGPFPRTLGFADTTLRMLPYDASHSKALLDSTGWREPSPGAIRQKDGKPLRFSMLVPTSSRPRIAYSVLIQEQLRRVGVQVDIEQIQINAQGQRQATHDFDAALIAQNTDPSPSGYKQQWSSAGAVKSGQNYVSYKNRAFDALLDSALATSQVTKARGYMSRAFQTAIDDAPAIWLYDLATLAGVHRRVNPAPMRADGWWSSLADWSIPVSARIDRDRIGLRASTQ